MTNQDVKQAFTERIPGRTTNLMSDGTSLWSYGWWEIARWVDGEAVLRLGPAFSMTTAHHRSGVAGTRAATYTPRGQANLNVEINLIGGN